VVLEDCTGCGVAGWGWQDDGYGTGVLGPELYFSGGPQTMRVQQREDGIAIDQIVLSPDTYLTASPGVTKNDTTILPKTRRSAEAITWTPDRSRPSPNVRRCLSSLVCAWRCKRESMVLPF
jgi:hypothetical protein